MAANGLGFAQVATSVFLSLVWFARSFILSRPNYKRSLELLLLNGHIPSAQLAQSRMLGASPQVSLGRFVVSGVSEIFSKAMKSIK